MDSDFETLIEKEMMEDHLWEIYYHPQHMWTGTKAIQELANETDYPWENIKQWLNKQDLWQIHFPPAENIKKPQYRVTEPNFMHQFNVMYMPKNRLQGSNYKYILTGIDAASRYKIARPLSTKKAEDVVFLLKHIYENDKIPLTYPKTFQCDNGSEFKGAVKTLLESKGLQIRSAKTKYRYSHTTFIEHLNKIIAVQLFKIMDAQELSKKGNISRIRVKYLYDLIDKLNNTITRPINLKPVEAIKMDKVEQNFKLYDREEVLPTFGKYQYLLK